MSNNLDSKEDNSVDYSNYYLKNYRKTDNEEYEYEIVSGEESNIPRIKALVPDEIDMSPYTEVHHVDKVDKSGIKEVELEDSNATKRKRNKDNPKQKSKNFILVVVTMILCFGLTILIADSVSNGYLLDSAYKMIFNKQQKSKTYYAVEIASFTDFNSAKLSSNEVRAMDGAGYVIQDELYRVIVEAYENKKDAISVSAKLNISGYITKIYDIEIGQINYSILPNSVRKSTETLLNYVDIVFKKLYELSEGIASKKIDIATALIDLAGLHSNIKNALVDYESDLKTNKDNNNVMKIRIQLASVVGALENLKDSKASDTTFLSDIRYTTVMVLNTHRALVNSLQ